MKTNRLNACLFGTLLLSNFGPFSMGQVAQTSQFGTVTNALQCTDATFGCPKDQPIPGVTWQSNIPANMFDSNLYRISNKGSQTTELVMEFSSDQKVVVRDTLVLEPNTFRDIRVNSGGHTPHFSVLEWHSVVGAESSAVPMSAWQDVVGDPAGPAGLQWRWNKLGDNDGCHVEYRDLKGKAHTFWAGAIYVTPPTKDPAKPTLPSDTSAFQRTGGQADSINAFCAYVKTVKATNVTRQ